MKDRQYYNTVHRKLTEIADCSVRWSCNTVCVTNIDWCLEISGAPIGVQTTRKGGWDLVGAIVILSAIVLEEGDWVETIYFTDTSGV